jgi:hypothetical protein
MVARIYYVNETEKCSTWFQQTLTIGLLTSPLPRKRSECQPCIARAAASLRVLPDPDAWISPASKDNVGTRKTMKRRGYSMPKVKKEERKYHAKWAKDP